MGRAARERHRRRKISLKYLKPDQSVIYDCMEDWMLSLDWFPVCELTPNIFETTGRGLECLENIEVDDVLVKIPRHLLITTSNLRDSYIIKIFQTDDTYEAQCVLAVFLAYEKHLAEISRWKPYIDSLPCSYDTPDFCSPKEKKTLSFVFENLETQFDKVKNNYHSIVRSIHRLRKINQHFCPHCGKPLYNILTFSVFKWAYYTINTRAIYIDGSKTFTARVNLKDANNMALAPFLDLFNHSYDAAVTVGIVSDNENREYYQLKTSMPFARGSQVFINYGPHDSLRLFMEYGFFIPNNPLDQISFDLTHVERCTSVPRSSLDFIVAHGLNKNMGFIAEGLSYDAKIVLFILSTRDTVEQRRMKVYNGELSPRDMLGVNSLSVKISDLRMMQLVEHLDDMKKLVAPTESFKIAMKLVKEYIDLLSRSREQINININDSIVYK